MTRRFDHKCALRSLQTGGPQVTIENGKGSTVTHGLLLRRAPAVSAAWGLSFVCRNAYLIPISGFLLPFITLELTSHRINSIYLTKLPELLRNCG